MIERVTVLLMIELDRLGVNLFDDWRLENCKDIRKRLESDRKREERKQKKRKEKREVKKIFPRLSNQPERNI